MDVKRWVLAGWAGLPLLVKTAAVLSVVVMLAVVGMAFAQWIIDAAPMFEIRRQINEQVCDDQAKAGMNCPP